MTFQLTEKQIKVLYHMVHGDRPLVVYQSTKVANCKKPLNKWKKNKGYVYGMDDVEVSDNCFKTMLNRGLIEYKESGMSFDNTEGTDIYVFTKLGAERLYANRSRQEYKRLDEIEEF